MKQELSGEIQAGTLYVCGTPIGNLGDMTIRALTVLREVDLIAAEDTRRTRKLLSHYGIPARMVSYHEHNERSQTVELINALKAGQKVALVTDAGMPGISDPGAHLVDRALSCGIPVVPIPGPSAVVAALAVSGFSADEFTFAGFLPRKGKLRREALRLIAEEKRAVVLYESPHRLLKTLVDLQGVLGGERRAAVLRELTKVHEEIRRGTLDELVAAIGGGAVKGEVTVVLDRQA